jgi:hypothetical protein
MRADRVKTSADIKSAHGINDDPDEGLEPEGNPADEDIEEGDEEEDEETGLPPAMPPGA